MNPPHAIATGLVQAALQAAFGHGWWVRCQLPLHIDAFNNPLPDFAVVPGSPRDYAGRHPSTAALVVEVSDTTLAFDAVEKAERYATAGIADYWIVDLVSNRLLVFRNPSGTDYLQKPSFAPADRVQPLAAPGQSVLVSDLLP
jgi:Uma2 family endonuclease